VEEETQPMTEGEIVFAYETLRAAIEQSGGFVLVCDYPVKGYVCCLKKESQVNAVIVVVPQRSSLHSLFLLAHEAGHIFNYPDDQYVMIGRPSKRMHGEQHAQEYAARVCGRLLHCDVREELTSWYEKGANIYD
jgi:hypothetical protein